MLGGKKISDEIGEGVLNVGLKVARGIFMVSRPQGQHNIAVTLAK